MQVEAKFEQAGQRISGIAIDLMLICEDGQVDAAEFPLLQAAIEELAEEGLVIEDAAYDVLTAIQVLRLGRQNAPDKRNLGPKILNFEEHRRRLEQRKAAVSGELAAAAGQ